MTTPIFSLHRCIDCNTEISSGELLFSKYHYGLQLCITCQCGFKTRYKRATSHAIRLYAAIRSKNIRAELEGSDGYKKIDIAISSAKLHIEVDGFQHHFRPSQALIDLQRTCYSLKDGYVTIRIPNGLIRKHLDQTVTYIADIVNERTIQLKPS